MSDDDRRLVPGLVGSSHAVFVGAGSGSGSGGVSLRFFTSQGELPACGHGTVAALAYLAERAGLAGDGSPHRVTLHTPGGVLPGSAVRRQGHIAATFTPAPVVLRPPADAERELTLAALGIEPGSSPSGIRVAAIGRARLLVPVATPTELAALAPDFDRLHAACDRLGLLGCFVYSVPAADGRIAARMFAPSIGVPEDIANANSTACLAAHLAGQGITDIAVDMGDSLGSPARITAAAMPPEASPSAADSSAGPTPVIHLGGTADVVQHTYLP